VILTVLRVLIGLGISWHPVRAGVSQAEFRLADEGPMAFVQVVALRLDPARLEFSLHTATREYGLRGAWTIDSLPPGGVVAFNGGQFRGGWPWGWLVEDGVETQAPGSGSLAMAFVVDSAGRAALLTADELPPVRGQVRTAFQSYPALLIGEGEEPWELRAEGRGVDLVHRDSRLAICTLPNGSVVVALTRFLGLGSVGGTLPFGPTVGEMAKLMRRLGCRRAMLLDGGISSQLVMRRGNGELARWGNWRAVPLGLVVTPRRPAAAHVSGTP
jgi:phosphodiester glycosidase